MDRYQNVHYIGDLTDIFDDMHDSTDCILDTFRHTNYGVPEKIAKRIFESVEPYLGQEFHIKRKNSAVNPI